MADEPSWKINLFILGNSAVGKSSFIIRYTKNTFKNEYTSTIGIDFLVKNTKLPTGENIRINFYDTAGQENYKSITFNLIKSADGILILYDITDQKSFEAVSGWVESIKEQKGNDFPIVILGNKCDLEKERIVKKEEGEKFGYPFFETSNQNGTNIEESVLALIMKIIEIKKKEEEEKMEKEGIKEEKRGIALDKKKTLKKPKSECKCKS